MGTGNLILSLIEMGLSDGLKISQMPIQNLFGNEISTIYYNQFKNEFIKLVGNFNDFNKNFTNLDFFDLSNHKKYDIIFGNPPYMLYSKLPDQLKLKYSVLFRKYHLIDTKKHKQYITGNSNLDISSVFIVSSIIDFLKYKGEAYFFLPLSLIHGINNNNFREFKYNGTNYSIKCIVNLTNTNVFKGVNTDYGFVKFIRDTEFKDDIMYKIYNKDSSIIEKKCFYFDKTNNFVVCDNKKDVDAIRIEKINISKEQIPRQGVNTLGCNDFFFFNSSDVVEYNEKQYKIIKEGDEFLINKEYIFPLINNNLFNLMSDFPNNNAITNDLIQKYVFLPYTNDGKIIDFNDLDDGSKDYINKFGYLLDKRRENVLNKSLKYKYSLFGVGKYNFAPFKIVWRAAGSNEFNPKLMDGIFQCNQNMFVYIPIYDKNDFYIFEKLLEMKDAINKISKMMFLNGKLSFCQPYFMKKLFFNIKK